MKSLIMTALTAVIASASMTAPALAESNPFEERRDSNRYFEERRDSNRFTSDDRLF
ncbi:MAG: hypothetical protein HC838_06715 [Spirulinaceae cyanobacterium RM2_2_10]|nr:hypothetical protein [Spirulinaceae cyanobacterium RM2_2_10]